MKPRTELLEGRQHLVVPVVMAVEGVLNGSRGPLFYPAKELDRSVPHWNGRPVVVYHPDMRFNYSAGNPEVFDRQRVGTLFNVRFDRKAKALKGEAWLDAERLQAVDPRVYKAVGKGEVMEVSTGLHTEADEDAGMHGDRLYIGTARNYQPDHLAILPDIVGACSIKDGAGLCRNEIGELPLLMPAVA